MPASCTISAEKHQFHIHGYALIIMLTRKTTLFLKKMTKRDRLHVNTGKQLLLMVNHTCLISYFQPSDDQVYFN